MLKEECSAITMDILNELTYDVAYCLWVKNLNIDHNLFKEKGNSITISLTEHNKIIYDKYESVSRC